MPTGRLLDAIRQPHTALVEAVLARPGHDDVHLQVTGGQVSVDAGSGVRRRLSLSLAGDADLMGVLSTPGAEIRPARGVRYSSGEVEWVPLGVFGVEEHTLSYGPDGQVSVSGADRWARVQRARFEVPRVTSGDVGGQVVNMVLEAVPGVAWENAMSVAATTRRAVWERDREEAVLELAAAAGGEVFFDAAGGLVLRDVPHLWRPPAWHVDASESGVMLSADRSRSSLGTHNVIVVVPSATDGAPPFPPVVVEDDDPGSPTYVGAVGRRPYFWASPLVTTEAQARRAGAALLQRAAGVATTLTLSTLVNPALDSGDVITVLLPDGGSERHLVESVTIPLDVTGAQQVTTRSTAPRGLPDEAPPGGGGGVLL